MIEELNRERLGFRELECNTGEFKFKLGIIDFLTVYNKAKYFENEIKSKVHRVDKKDISAIDSKTYQERFIEFMRNNM